MPLGFGVTAIFGWLPVSPAILKPTLSKAVFTVPPVTRPVLLSAICPSFATLTVKVFVRVLLSVVGVTVTAPVPTTFVKPVITSLAPFVIFVNPVSALPSTVCCNSYSCLPVTASLLVALKVASAMLVILFWPISMPLPFNWTV